MRRLGLASGFVAIVIATGCCAKSAEAASALPPGVVAAEAEMAAGKTTSQALVRRYIARIRRLQPKLHAIITLNPNALAQARELDAERRAGRLHGPLHGVPLLLKDNIESADEMATTAGSLALKDNVTHRDAAVVARLRAAGVVILGKTNLSEWANFRSAHSMSGWSAIGGMVRNPYALNRSACGSSAGSGAAVAAGLAAAAIGTETDGSVTCPASVNGVVGLKPTLGLVSRIYIVPISHTQDTAGPMGRSVEDVAALLTIMAGSDPIDAATVEADAHKTDYSAALSKDALRGKRIGVLQPDYSFDPLIAPLYQAAMEKLRAAGATVVQVKVEQDPKIGVQEHFALATEFKVGLKAYLASTDPAKVKVRTLADLIRFDSATSRETALFGQETFEYAQSTEGLDDSNYKVARAESQSAARAALDKVMDGQHLDALVSPTTGPAWTFDAVGGDRSYGGSASGLPAVAGYPHLTVPMGLAKGGLPVGLSFIGRPWSEAQLLAFGYAFQEQGARFIPPAFPESTEDSAQIKAAFAPLVGP